MGSISRRGARDEAIALFTKAIELDPTLAAAYYGRGVAHNETDVDLSLADLTKAIELDPTVAWCSTTGGSPTSPRACSTWPSLTTPRRSSSTRRMPRSSTTGGSCTRTRARSTSIADYTKAIEVDPLFDRPVAGRAYIYQSQGKLDLAIADYTKLTKRTQLNASDAQVYTRGVAYGDQGRFDLALADFTTAIELDPAYADAFYARGMVRQSSGGPRWCERGPRARPLLTSDPELVSSIKAYKCAQDLGCAP